MCHNYEITYFSNIMESKLNRQKNFMVSLSKPKHKNVEPEKQNTWSNLLNKKSASTNTVIVSKKKPKQSSPISEITKMKNKSDPCDDLSNDKPCQSSSLSVFNPIRTLQFLLREVLELPSIQNTDIKKIIDEMQVVVGRIVNESSETILNSKLNLLAINENTMIPTRENDYCKDLKYEYNPQENKYWLVLLEKISELENNYSQLTKNYTTSEEKLLLVTSERDKLIEKFKETCDSLEMLNNREREYLDTIKELKYKLMASEKLISKQEAIITNLNKKLNTLPNKNQIEENEQYNTCKAVLKQNNNFIKLNLNDKSKVTDEFNDTEIAKLRSDIKNMKKTVYTGLENRDITSMASMISEKNVIKDFTKGGEDNKKDIELDIDTQYSEYNRQASAIKLAKTEFEQLFEAISTQTHLSHKLFSSTIVNSDISDDEDNQCSGTNFISIITESNC